MLLANESRYSGYVRRCHGCAVEVGVRGPVVLSRDAAKLIVIVQRVECFKENRVARDCPDHSILHSVGCTEVVPTRRGDVDTHEEYSAIFMV